MKGETHRANCRPRFFLTAIAWSLAIAILPADAAAQWGGEVRLQQGFGGDQVANVEYSNGSDSDLKLGTYSSVLIGPIFEAWSSGRNTVELQAMVGWVGSSTGPENTEDRVKLNRFPVELLAFYGYRLPERDMLLRFGGGVSYHLWGGLSGSGTLEGLDVGMDNALGGTAEIGAVYGIISGGLRYTKMNTSFEGLPDSLNGSSVGLFVGITMPRY